MEREHLAKNEEAYRLAGVVKALSDPQRIEMMELMTGGSSCCSFSGPTGPQRPPGVCVCEIQQAFGLAQSRVSYHLRVLREAGLIGETSLGKWTFYYVDATALHSVLSLLETKILGTASH